ncbi:GntR family transcriptional regulator [Salinibacillus xinjiangensis]|uniref:FCD domain-containing protein n=1 Tax=Salinibacillus xinjiangensis TaxID=1229268 RepID=A0A6G1X1G6_9BACI|nr:GntR family transcriptional regulator [Salinibacillus xinjiangensis]MRG84837.1 FCD domain-containing protein [Salinibacillus xinjiangensis]
MKKTSEDEREEKIKGDFLLYLEGLKDFEQYRLPQRAYHIIRLAIRDLILPPGSMILEREMSEALEMSRTPVREALVRLETEGVLRLVPRRGFVVEPIEKQDLVEIYDIAGSLEGLAVDLATSNVGQEEIKILDEIVAEQEQALEQKDLHKWAQLDDRFHSSLIDFSQSKRLRSVIDIHADQIYRARLFTIRYRPLPFQSIEEHKAIISCIRAKDPKASRLLMQSHRKRTLKEILKVIDQSNGTEEEN